jgi:hypothetical protein
MALPTTLSTVTLTGTYVNLLGNPISGSITFQPVTILKETNLNVIIMPSYITKTLDANGSFTVTLPCTDDTDVTPEPFVYTVVENFTNGRTFKMALPLSLVGTSVNLADVLPSVSNIDASNYTTTDNYYSLRTRYLSTEATRIVVNDVPLKVDAASASATAASLSLNLTKYFNPNSLMLMGL